MTRSISTRRPMTGSLVLRSSSSATNCSRIAEFERSGRPNRPARAHRLAALVVAALVAAQHLDDGLTHLRPSRALLGEHLGGHLALLQEVRATDCCADSCGPAAGPRAGSAQRRWRAVEWPSAGFSPSPMISMTGRRARPRAVYLRAFAATPSPSNQAEQQVLRANVVVLKTAGLVLRETATTQRAQSVKRSNMSLLVSGVAARTRRHTRPS